MTDPSHKSAAGRAPAIMIVDDEAVVTDSLGTFLELETDYRVHVSQSPGEALRVMRETPVDLVISDFLMPEMNGLQFLAEVKRQHPAVPRILLTGYADKENAIRAINEVGLFQYVEKPWDNDQLKMVIDNALSRKRLEETLADRIRELDTALRERNRLAEEQELLRYELEVARRLQQSMLPDELPRDGATTMSATWLPALEIGGDFYDVIPLEGNRLAVLVADATGHGIQAALSTAILKFAFTRFSGRDVGSTDIVTGMNHVLHRGLPEEIYIAAMVLTIDMDTGEVEASNAGLPHPFLLKRDPASVDRVPANGFILGVVDSDLYQLEEPVTLRLESGDVLLVCTDGLGEAENDDGEQFDEKDFGTTLVSHAGKSVTGITKELVAAGRAFARKGHTWADITIVSVEVGA